MVVATKPMTASIGEAENAIVAPSDWVRVPTEFKPRVRCKNSGACRRSSPRRHLPSQKIPAMVIGRFADRETLPYGEVSPYRQCLPNNSGVTLFLEGGPFAGCELAVANLAQLVRRQTIENHKIDAGPAVIHVDLDRNRFLDTGHLGNRASVVVLQTVRAARPRKRHDRGEPRKNNCRGIRKMSGEDGWMGLESCGEDEARHRTPIILSPGPLATVQSTGFYLE
jgi:hypothetical protein